MPASKRRKSTRSASAAPRAASGVGAKSRAAARLWAASVTPVDMARFNKATSLLWKTGTTLGQWTRALEEYVTATQGRPRAVEWFVRDFAIYQTRGDASPWEAWDGLGRAQGLTPQQVTAKIQQWYAEQRDADAALETTFTTPTTDSDHEREDGDGT